MYDFSRIPDDELWWGGATGAGAFTESVVKSLQSGRSVILHVPLDLPWRRTMRAVMENTFRERTGLSDIVFDLWDMQDSNPRGDSPEKFLIARYSIGKYRKQSGVAFQDYLKRRGILKNRILWIKGLDGDQTMEWVAFCEEYPAGDAVCGLFVIETRDGLHNRRLPVIDYRKFVSPVDLQLFNSLIAAGSSSYKGAWKAYVSSLCAHLCGTDAEVSSFLLRNADLSSKEPSSALEMAAERFYARGEAGSGHILELFRNGDSDEINRRVWKAQVQSLFYMIEMVRIRIVENHIEDLSRAFDLYREDFPSWVGFPEDSDFGVLGHLMSLFDENGYRKLDVEDPSERQVIVDFRRCRNLLAHAKTCSVEQVRNIIAAYERHFA